MPCFSGVAGLTACRQRSQMVEAWNGVLRPPLFDTSVGKEVKQAVFHLPGLNERTRSISRSCKRASDGQIFL